LNFSSIDKFYLIYIDFIIYNLYLYIIILYFFIGLKFLLLNACLCYFVGLIRIFNEKKLVLHENQNAIKIAEKLDVKKYIVTNKSRYIHARAKNNMKTALFARNSTSQWKRVWFFHRRHGRRVLVSGKVRYGFLLDVW